MPGSLFDFYRIGVVAESAEEEFLKSIEQGFSCFLCDKTAPFLYLSFTKASPDYDHLPERILRRVTANSIIGIGLFHGLEFLLQKKFRDSVGFLGLLLFRTCNNTIRLRHARLPGPGRAGYRQKFCMSA